MPNPHLNENLQKSKKKLEELALEIAKDIPRKSQYEQMIYDINDLFQNPLINYKDVIHLLHKARDENAGIRVKEIKSDNGNFLIRDTRLLEKNYQTNFAYQIQFLNMIRSAKTMLEIEGKLDQSMNLKIDNLAKYVYDKFKSEELVNSTEKDQQVFLLQHNDIIIDELSIALGQDKKMISKDLQLTMDYANFDDDHYHMSTISKLGDKEIIQSDVALLGYTDEQNKTYFSFLNTNQSLDEIRRDKLTPDYFTNLSSYEQKLVYKHRKDICGGRKVHNTQLRKIPGVKNAYDYSISVLEEGVLVEKLSELRMGTLYSTNKSKDSQEISAKTAEQVKEFAGRQVHFNTLVTPILFGRINPDKLVYQATENAANATGNLHSNVALNQLRFLSTNKYQGTNTLLSQIAGNLDKICDNSAINNEIKSYLKGEKFTDIDERIDSQIEDPNVRSLLKDVIKLKQLVEIYKGFDLDNIGLEINRLTSAIIYQTKDIIKCENLISCKSGKDRTGAQAMFNSAKAIEKEIADKESAEVIEMIAKTGHLQISSAKQGGRQGCFGILPGTGKAIPSKYIKASNLLALQAANLNKDKQTEYPYTPVSNAQRNIIFSSTSPNSANSLRTNEKLDPYSPNASGVKQTIFKNFDEVKIDLKDNYNIKAVIESDKKDELVSQRQTKINEYKHEVEQKLSKVPEATEASLATNKRKFGNKEIGFISVTVNEDRTYSFEPEIHNGKGITCIYPVPSKIKGAYDIMKFENGELKSIIYADKALSNLNKDNVALLKSITKIAAPLIDFSSTGPLPNEVRNIKHKSQNREQA